MWRRICHNRKQRVPEHENRREKANLSLRQSHRWTLVAYEYVTKVIHIWCLFQYLWFIFLMCSIFVSIIFNIQLLILCLLAEVQYRDILLLGQSSRQLRGIIALQRLYFSIPLNWREKSPSACATLLCIFNALLMNNSTIYISKSLFDFLYSSLSTFLDS